MFAVLWRSKTERELKRKRKHRVGLVSRQGTYIWQAWRSSISVRENEEQLVGWQFFLIAYRSKFSSPSIWLNQIKMFDFNISKLICRVMSRRSRPLCRHATLLPTCYPEERCVTTQVTVAYETRLQNNQKPNELNRHSPNRISKHCTQEFWSITSPKVSELSLVQRENI